MLHADAATHAWVMWRQLYIRIQFARKNIILDDSKWINWAYHEGRLIMIGLGGVTFKPLINRYQTAGDEATGPEDALLHPCNSLHSSFVPKLFHFGIWGLAPPSCPPRHPEAAGVSAAECLVGAEPPRVFYFGRWGLAPMSLSPPRITGHAS